MQLLKGGPPPAPEPSLPIGAARSYAAASPGVIYQIKIAPGEITPLIRGRAHVPADLLLSELALVLIETVGWTNSHLREFKVNGIRYGEPDPEGDDFDLGDLVDESDGQLATRRRKRNDGLHLPL